VTRGRVLVFLSEEAFNILICYLVMRGNGAALLAAEVVEELLDVFGGGFEIGVENRESSIEYRVKDRIEN